MLKTIKVKRVTVMLSLFRLIEDLIIIYVLFAFHFKAFFICMIIGFIINLIISYVWNRYYFHYYKSN